MRLISPLSIDSIVTFTGAIITDRNIVNYDSDLDLEEIINLPYSEEAKIIENISTPFTKFLSFYKNDNSYNDWKVKSIILYKGTIGSQTDNTIVLAILNEDREQSIRSKKFNFRLYFNSESDIVDISYTGSIAHLPYISKENNLIKPFSEGRSDLILTKEQATELNNNQLTSAGLIVKDSNVFMNPLTKLELTSEFEFKLILPQLIEGIPFLTGLIKSIEDRTKNTLFSIDLVNRVFYILTSDNSFEVSKVFLPEFLKPYRVRVVASQKDYMIGSTYLSKLPNNRGYNIYDLIRDALIESSANESIKYGFPTTSEYSDYLYLDFSNWIKVLNLESSSDNLELMNEMKEDISIQSNFIRLLTDSRAVFVDFSPESRNHKVLVINRKTGTIEKDVNEFDQIHLILATTDNGLLMKYNSGINYEWISLIEGEELKTLNDNQNYMIINLFGRKFFLINNRSLTRI